MPYTFAASIDDGLQLQPGSGLTFPWAEENLRVEGSFDAHLGPDGAGVGMTMLINWEDLQRAAKEILGYSWRDISGGTPGVLRRVLPMQHPFFSQLWARSITKVVGLQQQGKNTGEFVLVDGDGAGVGSIATHAPFTDFNLARITISFWRPPYFVRTDRDILDANGLPREYLRYVDKTWQINSNMLSREGGAFRFLNLPSGTTTDFPGSVGQVTTHLRVSKTWYEVPEACLFQMLATDGTPLGIPYNLLYTQTVTKNLISGTNYLYPAGQPIGGCVNAPIGGAATNDADASLRFFGCFAGTLRYDAVEIKPRPLQLPALLMQIPQFGSAGEPISQVQYDVTFHFDLFDPPTDGTFSYRGHNLMPWAGNGLWYPVISKLNKAGAQVPPGTDTCQTPFQYADFTDLFKVL